MKHKNFRILLLNVGYGTELSGSFRDYALRFYRYLYTPRQIIADVRHALAVLLQRTKPDLCCFVEIRKRTMLPHIHAFAFHDIENKYGKKSVLRKAPFFRRNCNGFLSVNPVPFHKYFLQSGMKKLVYRLQLPNGIALFLVHLALEPHVRRKQLKELSQLTKNEKRAILCGDFNANCSRKEIHALAKDCNLRILNHPSDRTFPAAKPRRSIDLFLCSMNIDVQKMEVLRDVHLSDHLPVVLDLSL